MARTAAEISARLVKINAAIDFILTGNAQSSAAAGRSLTMLDLGKLEALRKADMAELAALEASSGKYRPGVVRFRSTAG